MERQQDPEGAAGRAQVRVERDPDGVGRSEGAERPSPWPDGSAGERNFAGAGPIAGRTGTGNGERRREEPMKGDGMAERLLESGVDALAVTAALSSRSGGRHVASRRIRCGAAGGARHAEARGAERADLVHELRLAVKEMRESRYWLTLIDRAWPGDLYRTCAARCVNWPKRPANSRPSLRRRRARPRPARDGREPVPGSRFPAVRFPVDTVGAI